MGFLGKVCGCSAVLVAVIAVLIGSFFTVIPERVGLFSYLDNFVDGDGNRQMMGIGPAVHTGVAFGFEVDQIPDLKGKVILVTGATSGLGLSTAMHLAGKGATVVLGCRSMTKGEAAAKDIRATHPTALLEPLVVDLGSFKSIRTAAKEFTDKHQTLHSLVLNAGIMMNPFGLTEDGIELQFGVNHMGHFLLTQLLLPTVEATATPTDPATVVVLTSMSHFSSYPEGVRLTLEEVNDANTYDASLAYGQSKLANVLFAQELATRVKGNVLVNSVHPGGVVTDLGRHIIDKVNQALPAPFGSYAASALLGALNTFWWQPEVASLTQLYCAVGPTLMKERITGGYFHPIARQTKPCSKHSTNEAMQKSLWALSEELAKR